MAKAKECLARAKAKLNDLEGSVSLGDVEDEVSWLFDEEVGVESKVHRTLKDNVAFWHESGASQFALSGIENGYIPAPLIYFLTTLCCGVLDRGYVLDTVCVYECFGTIDGNLGFK